MYSTKRRFRLSRHPAFASAPAPAPAPGPAPAPAPVAFSPMSISGGDVWFDAKDPATITLSGTNVTGWTNKGALSTSAVKGGTSNPVYDAATNSIVFSRTAGDAFFSAPYTGTNFDNNITVFVMHSLLGTGTSSYAFASGVSMWAVYDASNQSSGVSFAYTLEATNTSLDDLRFFRANSVNLRLPFTRPPADELKLLVARKNGLAYTVHDNGTIWQSATGGSDNLFNPSANLIRIGAQGPADRRFNGKIYEIIMYNRALTETERQTVEGYMCHRWGRASALPANHPYKAAAP